MNANGMNKFPFFSEEPESLREMIHAFPSIQGTLEGFRSSGFSRHITRSVLLHAHIGGYKCFNEEYFERYAPLIDNVKLYRQPFNIIRRLHEKRPFLADEIEMLLDLGVRPEEIDANNINCISISYISSVTYTGPDALQYAKIRKHVKACRGVQG